MGLHYLPPSTRKLSRLDCASSKIIRSIPVLATPCSLVRLGRRQRLLSPWAKGPVALCGDAAHPMMPNLGQGGCQATEDGYRFAQELAAVRHTKEVPGALSKYSRIRVIRTAIVQVGSRPNRINCSHSLPFDTSSETCVRVHRGLLSLGQIYLSILT